MVRSKPQEKLKEFSFHFFTWDVPSVFFQNLFPLLSLNLFCTSSATFQNPLLHLETAFPLLALFT